MKLSYWPTTRPRPPKIISAFKGVNKLDRFSQSEEYATDLKNVAAMKTPNISALTLRSGSSLLGSALAAKILGLGVWKDTELHTIANGSWYKWTGSAWSAALASGLSASAPWSFANFDGNLADIGLIGANGVDPIKLYNGSTVANLTGAPAGGNYIAQFADRLWCAVGNQLIGSAYRKADDWSTVSNPPSDADYWYSVVETPDGETINALKPGIGHLTIFKPSSMFELFGYAPSDYRVQPVTFEIGTINNNCVITINGIMYILNGGGLYKYQGGLLPAKDFSAPVQDYIDNINSAAKQTCSLGTDGQKLYAAIPIDSSTAPDTVLEYDPAFGVWFVWKDFSPITFAQMGENWYMGQSDGKVLQMGGIDDQGSAIAWEWVSKPFGSGSLAQRIRWYKAWIVADIPTGSTLNVYLSKSDTGDADWTLVKAVSADAAVASTRVIIPSNVVANANFIRVKFSGSGPFKIYEFAREEASMPLV